MIRLLLNRFPFIKLQLKKLLGMLSPGTIVSSGYTEVNEEEISGESLRLRNAWRAEILPKRQRRLVDQQLADFRRGVCIDVFDVLVRALGKRLIDEYNTSVLEVGCSSGYYSEVLTIANLAVTYTGCDYSEQFVQLARQIYPELHFDVEDAAQLSYADNAFDIVISGCCLLHIAEYKTAIAETARVAACYAIFHRTPVVIGRPDRYFRKMAYGVETLEIHFNESDFLELLADNGLELLETYSLSETHNDKCNSAVRTYVCKTVTQ